MIRLSARDALGLGRFHLVALAALAAAVFGWLFDGKPGFLAGGLVGFDWFVLKLFNRVADVPEDRRNGVAGTEFAAQHAGALMRAAFFAFAASLLGAQRLGTPLLILRIVFQVGGFAYSFPTVVPRIKEMFLVKNVFLGALFIVSVAGYPLALGAQVPPAGEVVALCAFALPLEVTYELIYDLRDAVGDRAEGIVTVPVKWGAARTRALIFCLLALSAAVLMGGYFAGALRSRQLVMMAAPIQQAVILRLWIPRAVTRRAATNITRLGAAELAAFVIWVAAGLPLERPW